MSFPGFPAPPSPGPGPTPTPNTHNLLSSTHGDTNPASGVAGDLIYGDGSGIWTRLPLGIDGYVLTSDMGSPMWRPVTGSGNGDVVGPSGALNNYIAVFDGLTGKLIKVGNAFVNDNGDLFVGNTIFASGDLRTDNNLFVGGAANVQGDTTFGSNTTTSGNAIIGGDLTVSGVINGNIDLAASGFVVGPATAINNYIAIYDGTTGRLIKVADALVNDNGDLFVGNTVVASGDVRVLTSLFVNGTINVQDEADFAGTVRMSGSATVEGDLTVNGVINGNIELGPSGFVVGPASATDNSIALYDGTTGKLIKDSPVTIDSAGNISGVNNLSANTLVVSGITNTGPTIQSFVNATGPTYIVGDETVNLIPSGTTTVLLPSSPTDGQLVVIKDTAGVAGTTPIAVSGQAGLTIDGLATQNIAADYGAFSLLYGGVEWHII